MEIGAERLILRGWRESDLGPWAAMNADPEVRRFLGPLLTPGQAEAWVLNFQDDLDRRGFGFWALEVAWRLARTAWGHGYATEAARAVLEYGFGPLGLPEIVAVTMAGNARSRAVMERIGMTRDPAGDFDDPDVIQRPLRRHVVYRKRPDPR
jgi:RimJ/RimL family protein N-acetyltransferase